MLDPKLYVFDIDGTLLTTDYKILPSTKEAMGLLKRGELSAPIMLASARSPKAIDPIAEELNLEPFYVSLNGAFIVRAGEVLYERPMDQQATEEVIAIGEEAGLSVNVYSSWDWYIREENHWSTHEAKMVGWQGQVRDLEGVQAHKILFMGEQDLILKVQRRLEERVPSVSAQRSIPHYLEIVDAETNKGQALKNVSELLDLPLEHMVAFGDGENDLAMLRQVGFAVAMGNAHPALKAKADFVTLSNDEAGIFHAVQKLLELGRAR